MREILFRGKRADNGQWVEGMLDGGNGRYMINCRTYSDYSNGYWVYEVDAKTIGQYTGLTDRNGKKIFEGDIVNMHGGCEEMGAREYCIRCMVVYGRKGYGAEIGFTGAYKSGMQIPLMCEGALTVIGNIHDNPELLEGNK